jgi:hypothetical protein
MDHNMQSLFGPLERKYCDWFFYLSLVAFIFMILTLMTGVFVLMQKKMKTEYVVAVLWSSAMYGAFYFQNRLLYTMCLK